MRTCSSLFTVVLVLCAASARAAEAPKTAYRLAPPCRRPAGAPKAGDVVMRTLRFHPANQKDPRDTMQAIRDFHVTRIEWAYVNNKEQIDRIKGAGCLFGGAASAPSYTKDDREPGWFEKVVVVNRLGEPIIAPWKRTWKRTLWGCVNNPELERGYMAYLRRYIDAGAQVMQRDEPGANELATRWGGCFCPHCMKGFRKYLAEHTTPEERARLGIAELESFDYAKHLAEQNAPVGDPFGRWKGGRLKDLFVDFQRQSTIAFHRRTRKALDEYAGRRVPFSCNNGVRRWTPVQLQFDWAFGELSYGHARPGFLHEAIREAARHDRIQVVTMPKKGDTDNPEAWQRRTRQTIATAYACGGLCMVPWDVFMPRDAPRYFGTAEQYADLFGFIRAESRYLDGYALVVAVGKEIKPAPGGHPEMVAVEGGSGQVLAVVRAVSGQADAPVVVHLVDWAAEPRPLTLRLRTAAFFGRRPLAARLLRPAAYDRAAHQRARQSHDYSALSQAVALKGEARGAWTVVQAPALSPWGMLVVSPRKSE